MSKFAPKKTQVTREGHHPSTLSYFKYKLVVVQGAATGREFVVDRDRVQVGSSPENDLQIDDDTVSRRHFEIQLHEESYLIRDLGSTNGTSVEGCWIREAFLHPGARIGAGEAVLVFQPLQEKVEIPLSQTNAFGRMLGASTKMRALFHLAGRIAVRDANVLVTGETGTGKGLLAEEVHAHSPRAKGPFVVVDCATIPADLMESELFGHVKGAFTGAVAARPGAFLEANRGTIFFDEIGELPLPLQPKLLRVLEKREVKPVGTNDTAQVDVRILAATNRELKAEVAAGRFREDLYFRLSVIELRIPALRERRDDIPYLAREFLLDISGDPARRFGDDALRLLGHHDWPGNVRELRNVIERVAQLVDDPIIDRGSLMSTALAGVPVHTPTGSYSRGNLSFEAARELAEREYLVDLLRRHRFNVTAAARTAGIHRQSLHRLLRKHDLKASELEPSDPG
ncbi:MAG TPA: sigma 54-interacting transcriptional regulator [Myxococcota bacterium]|nr:sigma 54-interacting transcriptional regulator [Myxococcota bacterium]HRY95151.1 sigma 54-interacting transcriptional regulator [Myxococcota bacterium]